MVQEGIMIRFQCPHCRGIVASEVWEAGVATVCAYCSKEVTMPVDRVSPGVVIGDFLLIRKLGEGGMGIVYLAHQLSLDRPAAIKILNAAFSQQTDAVQGFIREARSAAKLNHQNIVQAYAVGEDDGIYYLAMEYIDGKTMKTVLQECKKLSPRRAAEIIMQVAEGLECAWNEQKLIHHDIKPDNIMQCANDRVKLTDLGLACAQGEDGNDDSNEVVGTMQYISPEQLTGVATDTRSDIYSLGATFYHFVTGQFPYNGENTDEIARQHIYGKLVPPKDINPDLPQILNDIIVKMMAKTPEERYQNCRDVAAALKDFLKNENKPAAGGLSGGLNGGLNSGKITLGAASGGGLKTSGGLSGGLSGGGAQNKIVVPSGQSKISLKISGRKEEAKAPENAPAAAAENVPEKIETPEDANAVNPTIKLVLKKPAAVQETPVPVAEAPEKADAQAQAVEENAPEKIAGDVVAENSQVDNTAAAAEQISEVVDDAKEPVVAEAVEAENVDGKKSGSAAVIITLIVLLLAGAVVGGLFFWKNSNTQKTPGSGNNIAVANKPEVGKFVIPQAEEEEPAEPTPTVAENKKTKSPKTTKEVARGPVLSPFMREAGSLESLYFSNERSFLQRWKQRAGALKPKTAEEKKLYETLDDNYVVTDEKLTVEPARSDLLKTYQKQVESVARRAEQTAFKQRIADAEKAAKEFSEASAENYAADLERKKGLLDYAMIAAARSRRQGDVKNFQKALALAKAEPERVADREGFVETAKKLVEHAEMLEWAFSQGKEFTEFLEKNKFKGKKIPVRNSIITVVSSNRNSLTATESPGKNSKAKNTKPKTHKVNLVIKNPKEAAENRAWIRLLERDIGRSNQYFYYMIYNCYLEHSIASIAPDDAWKKHINKVMRNYFDCAIFKATTAELTALKKAYGKWKDFQDALKAFEEKN